MATINLGAIKFNWKGAYNSSTTYAVDDVVSSGGNSYVCIQAHSNQAVGNATAYWNIMSSAGTNGTNGDTFGLANNEIAFKTNAGALDGIAIGSAGQALKVNSGANGYEFGAVTSGLKQVVYATNSTEFETSSTSFVALPPEITITPASTSSKIVIQSEIPIGTFEDGYPDMTLYRKIGSGSYSEVVTRPTNPNGGNSQTAWVSLRNNSNAGENKYEMNGVSDIFRDAPNTTSAVTYKWYGKTSNGGGLFINCSKHQIDNNTNTYNMLGVSKMICWEIAV